jgi:recombination protein RecT
MAVQGKGNQDLKDQLKNNSQALQKAPTVSSLLAMPEYKSRFTDILRDRAPQFISSILNVSRGMEADPKSIIMAAAVAATLDLPIDKNLGYAWIVPFKEKGFPVAQFQMGWKGYVQLALRTGQYKGIGAVPVYEGEVKYYDELLGLVDYEPRDDVKPDEIAIGYVAKFRLLNGFEKALYWKRDRCEKHGKRYSQTYKKGYGRWAEDFDAMALKTVIKQLLSKWGILSIEMQKALKADDAAIKSDNLDDVKSVEYVDGADYSVDYAETENTKDETVDNTEPSENQNDGEKTLLDDEFAGTPFAKQ